MRIRANRFTAILFLFMGIWVATASATVEISGVIAGDTTWTNADPIIVTGSVTITASGRLTVEPGAVIRFNPSTGVYVAGQLIAEGEPHDRIVFSCRADTAGGAPEAGMWNGVHFQQGSDGILRDCDLQYASQCVHINNSSPRIERCVIENFAHSGIYMDGVASNPPITPVIKRCVIGQSRPSQLGTGVGIHVRRTVDVSIDRCAITACSLGVELYGVNIFTPHFRVTGCEIRDHSSHGIFAHALG